MRRSFLTFVVGVVIAWAWPLAPALDAQVTPPASGRLTARDSAAILRILGGRDPASMTQAELLDRIRQSGLTREQIRERLRQLGYDPALADPYFDAIEGGGEVPRGLAGSDVLGVLAGLGVPVAPEELAPASRDSGRIRPQRDTLDASAGDAELEIFGRAVFQRETSEFEPVRSGPVGRDYRLGPGDELVLVLTGDVEASFFLPVTREGFLIIPDVGQVSVNGLTLAELEDRLYGRLARVYSGVRRGAGATTQFQVTLGRLRANQVYVIGEVERPSAYVVSANSSVFEALYQAGGPSRNGSFRAVAVYRSDGRAATVDLYEYLLAGWSRSDLRLEQGDRIFVPPYRRRVTIKGAVRRPAIYELVEGEDLRDALAFAGGLAAEAALRRVQIDRILPPERRRPGVERVLIDVDVSRISGDDTRPVELRDGDVVEIFAVSHERRNRVVVTGEVQRPGTYEWSDGLTLWELIDGADGLAERAYTPRAHVYRLVEADGSRRVIRTPLLADSAGAAIHDLMLSDRDSVVVFSRSDLRNEAFVTIDGFVKGPGTYPLAEGMTVHDLILVAGGFAEGAETREAEVVGMPNELTRNDTTAVVIRVSLDADAPTGAPTRAAPVGVKAGAPAPEGRAGVPVWPPDSSEYRLRAGDRVFIRKAIGYELARSVKVTGEVLVPGTFVLETREERIVNVIRRAGGLTDQAYASGVQLFRGGKLVATDLFAAMGDEASRYNLALQPGDSLHIPEYDPTVLVTGAVAFETLVLFEPGRSLDYYVNRAGGYVDVADRDRVTVTYLDGERATAGSSLLLFKSMPAVRPGSTIHVPEKPPAERGGFDLDRFLTRTTGMLMSVLTVWIAINQLGDGG